MTLALKSLIEMSHLPEPVLDRLKSVVLAVDERLQSETHKISRAISVDSAFDRTFIESGLIRAMICSVITALDDKGVWAEELPNGGCEIRIGSDAREYLFRFKRATLDRAGNLVVTASSDSLLTRTAKARVPSLFDDEEETEQHAFTQPNIEQWLLPYLVDSSTRTFNRVYVARPVGTKNDTPPFRLILEGVVAIPLSVPTPLNFPKSEEDLVLDDVEDGTGEAIE